MDSKSVCGITSRSRGSNETGQKGQRWLQTVHVSRERKRRWERRASRSTSSIKNRAARRCSRAPFAPEGERPSRRALKTRNASPSLGIEIPVKGLYTTVPRSWRNGDSTSGSKTAEPRRGSYRADSLILVGSHSETIEPF